MTGPVAIGIVLTICAGLMSGNCMLPMKFTHTWKWENTWLVFSVVSLVILPWALAFAFVSNLGEIYRSLSPAQLAAPMLFGLGWGIAQALFGISIQRLGLSLAYGIIIGLGALLGTLIPLYVQQRTEVGHEAFVKITSGVMIMVAGIVLFACGGHAREGKRQVAEMSVGSRSYAPALLMAILCGLLAPMLNYSFAFGRDIERAAVLAGNSEVHASYAVWPIGLLGGLISNVAYSLYLLHKNKTFGRFRPASPDLFLSILMGILWMGAFALYGMSASYLGALGTSLGWALLQIFMIMAATLSGIWLGEWKDSPLRAWVFLSSGTLCLTGATVLLAMGANRG